MKKKHVKRILFMLSRVCPNNCLYCSVKHIRKVTDSIDDPVDLKYIKNILENYTANDFVTIFGVGETFAVENIKEVVDCVASHNDTHTITMITSAKSRSVEWFNSFFNEIEKYDNCNFSIGLSLHIGQNNIKQIENILNNFDNRYPKHHIWTTCVVNRDTIEEFKKEILSHIHIFRTHKLLINCDYNDNGNYNFISKEIEHFAIENCINVEMNNMYTMMVDGCCNLEINSVVLRRESNGEMVCFEFDDKLNKTIIPIIV